MSLLTNLLAYWKLDDDGSGGVSLVDSTGNGNTLTNNGGVALGTGKIGGDAVLGSGAYLDSVNNITLNQNWTISIWVNPEGIQESSFTRIFEIGTLSLCSFEIDESLNAKPAFFTDDAYTTDSVQLTVGSWNHFVIVANNGMGFFYWNGILIGSVACGEFLDAPRTLHLGRYGGSTTGLNFNGSIDEVGIWNRALTSAEVTALYNGGSGLSYPFSSKTPQTISEFSPIANRIVGAAPFTITAPTASSGLAVTLSVKSGPATISGNTITLTGTTGTVVIAANQSGNATFDPAPEVTTSFSVTAATPSVGLTLRGSTSELILVSTNFSQDSSGQCMLRRVYSCATTYESTARVTLAIDSAPLDGFLPSGVYSLVLSGLSVDRGAGISTFSADYIGLTTKAVKTTFSESTLSYSFVKAGTFTIPASGGTPATTVPVRYAYTGQYSAPVATTTQVATSASSIPGVPAGATQPVRATSSFRALIGSPNGQPMAPEPFTATYSTAWVLTDSQATPYGNRFIVTATYTRLITGVTN